METYTVDNSAREAVLDLKKKVKKQFVKCVCLQVSVSDGIAADNFFADIGPKTISLFSRVIKRSKLCLWVGCVGICTCPEFTLVRLQIVTISDFNIQDS